jgi:hypothetical protein
MVGFRGEVRHAIEPWRGNEPTAEIEPAPVIAATKTGENGGLLAD